jgi:hypothetical protein
VNLLAAVIGTAIIEAPLTGFVRPSRVAAVKADLLTITVAFGLGYFVYRRWSPSPSKWVWLAGLFWFGQRTLLTLDGQHGRVFWELAGHDFVVDSHTFENWSGYTLPFLRTIFYSMGALWCSRWRRKLTQ